MILCFVALYHTVMSCDTICICVSICVYMYMQMWSFGHLCICVFLVYSIYHKKPKHPPHQNPPKLKRCSWVHQRYVMEDG